MVVIVLLACLWLFLAYRAYSRGDNAMAGLFLAIGAALTVYRLTKRG